MKGVKGFQKGHPSYVGRFEKNHRWIGDKAKRTSGNKRAQRMFPIEGKKCPHCGTRSGLIRHHINGDTLDNRPENIRWPCRGCHKKVEHPDIGKSTRFTKKL